jgi:cellulose synthase/poly-beta-1,6-N-acetylglucosamine synthase-like glycosyltransferase
VLLVALAVFALAGQALAALLVWFNHRHTPELGSADWSGDAPDLLCVVPARNEERNIVACVESLAASRYPGRLRVRVVDDGSTDGTAALVREVAARAPGVELVPVERLPPGWLGKNHALHVGTRGAREPWLLFVDADLRVGPDCLARAVAAADGRAVDLLTMIPRLEARSFWERAVQPLVAGLIYAWLPARDVNDPRKRAAAAIGPFMLFRRAAYEQIGGHQAVRAEVVEDRALAEAVKRAGLRLLLVRGVGLASLRMYDSLAAIVRGWSKNFHVAFGPARWAAPLVASALLAVYAGPYLLPLVAAAAGAPRALAVGAAAAALALAARFDLARRYGVSARAGWLAPLGAAVVALILIRSVLPGRLQWKGRAIR